MKTKIDFESFFKKGLKKLDDADFRVYVVTGQPGSGKTFATTRLLVRLRRQNPDLAIYSNIIFKGSTVTPFDRISEITKLTTPGIIVIDEFFQAYSKTDKIPAELLGWLALVRHHKQQIVIVAQEWLELNMSIRHSVQRHISVKKLPVLPIIVETWGDATNLQYDDQSNEYVAPVYRREIYKRTEEIGKLYNTHQLIKLYR